MVKCKFCGLGDVIKKSHIIPEFMYENTYDDKLRMIAFESDLTQVRLRQKGYYEPILCRNCENFFNVNFEKPCVGLFRALPTQVAQNNFVKPLHLSGANVAGNFFRGSTAQD